MTLSAANHENRPATLRHSASNKQTCRVRFASTPEHEAAQDTGVRRTCVAECDTRSLLHAQKQLSTATTNHRPPTNQVVSPYSLLSLRHGSQADKGGKSSMEDVVLLVDDVERAVGHTIPGPEIKAFFAVRGMARELSCHDRGMC